MNSTDKSPAINVNITDSAGSQLISLILVWGLFGLLVAQVYIFFTAFPADKAPYKFMVYLLFILEVIQTALTTHDAYRAFVLDFGDPVSLETVRTAWFSVPVATGMIGFIAQIFYAHRIWKISGSNILSGVIIMFAITQLGSALAEGVKAYQAQYFFVLRAKVLPVTVVWLLSTVICDVLIAVVMTFFLLKFKRELHHTSFPISKLVSLSVETGVATAAVATATGILFVVRRSSLSFNIPAYTLGKLYSNSLLRMLNSRILIGNNAGEPLPSNAPEITTLPLSFDHGPTPRSFVMHFGDVEVLEGVGLMWLTTPMLSGLVGWIAELFYAWRIHKISRNPRATVAVGILSFIQLGAGIAEGMRAHSANTLPHLRWRHTFAAIPLSTVLWILAIIVCDVVIALVMTYYLVKLRKEFHYDSSHFIRKLLTLSVETGSATGSPPASHTVLFFGRPQSESFHIPSFTISKMYSNPLLRVLNSRCWTGSSEEVISLSSLAHVTSTSRLETRSLADQPSSSRAHPGKREDGTVVDP
ncbi:hypothetical protein NP233_g3727 [Leucocoprinus birnbaumii]|uniref:DUF6534 domain-containing protein n=1 Tax=Leucocoprinus birnbaumii TaxID=56174 RepID=A0AAD5YSJ6_9AGAR|nr:hypothetical protein NP233_g3727 [Leucocoprinus birnbaumii]